MQGAERNLDATGGKGRRKSGRCYRRAMNRHKEQRLRGIIRREHWYYPCRGYIDWDFVDGIWQEVGKYIKYPKNSNRQQYLKKQSSRRVRHYPCLPPKGNGYRRVFDYWWELD